MRILNSKIIFLVLNFIYFDENEIEKDIQNFFKTRAINIKCIYNHEELTKLLYSPMKPGRLWIIITSGKLAENYLQNKSNDDLRRENIGCIVIYCSNINYHKSWSKKFNYISEVTADINILINTLAFIIGIERFIIDKNLKKINFCEEKLLINNIHKIIWQLYKEKKIIDIEAKCDLMGIDFKKLDLDNIITQKILLPTSDILIEKLKNHIFDSMETFDNLFSIRFALQKFNKIFSKKSEKEQPRLPLYSLFLIRRDDWNIKQRSKKIYYFDKFFEFTDNPNIILYNYNNINNLFRDQFLGIMIRISEVSVTSIFKKFSVSDNDYNIFINHNTFFFVNNILDDKNTGLIILDGDVFSQIDEKIIKYTITDILYKDYEIEREFFSEIDKIRDTKFNSFYSLAIQYKIKNIKVLEKLLNTLKPDEEKYILKTYYMGCLCELKKDFERAAAYFEQTLTQTELLNFPKLRLDLILRLKKYNPHGITENFGLHLKNASIGELFQILQVEPKFIKSSELQKVISIHEKSFTTEIERGSFYTRFADIHLSCLQYESAIKYYNEGLRIWSKMDIKYKMIYTEYKIGFTCFRQEHYEVAREHCILAINHYNSYYNSSEVYLPDFRLIMNIYQCLGNIFKKQSNFNDLSSVLDIIIRFGEKNLLIDYEVLGDAFREKARLPKTSYEAKLFNLNKSRSIYLTIFESKSEKCLSIKNEIDDLQKNFDI